MCTEQSLSNLGLDTIDVQQFHVWQDDWVGQGDWLGAVEDLKREGKIRAFGVSINDHQASNAVRLIETGGRYGAGDLQRLRPEPGGPAPAGLPGTRHRRDSQGTLR